jgi:hypothetical protein
MKNIVCVSAKQRLCKNVTAAINRNLTKEELLVFFPVLKSWVTQNFIKIKTSWNYND